MIKKAVFSLILLTALSSHVKSQTVNPEDVAFTVNGQAVSVGDLERFYLKNLDIEKNKPTAASVDEYLEMFKHYKLKVHEAYQMKLDTVPNFISELEMYRDGLAKPYLTDKEVTESLILEAYNRMKYEVKASHILVFCSSDEVDTTAAYEKIKAIWNKLQNPGESFETVAFNESEDPSAKDNNGDLGYFTALNMIYSFENMAYNTPVGQTSPVFRTEYGYHILKVFDKRENRGEIKVADILLQYTPGASAEENADVDRRITAIYDQLKTGAKWEDMVAKFSDDFDTKPNGGEMNWFSATEKRLPEALVNAAFSIENKGDICKPFKISNGWMILKKLDQKPLVSFDDMKSYIKQRISRDSRSNKSQAVMVQKIKNTHKVATQPENIKAFVKTLDSAVLKAVFDMNGWTSSNPKIKGNAALTIDNDVFTLSDFSEYIFKSQTVSKSKSIEGAINRYYSDFVDASCIKFIDNHLSEMYPEYRYIYQEYKDGILVFNLMDMKVWSPGVVDTVQQQKFYEENKNKYMWADRYDLDIYNARTKKIHKSLKKQLTNSLKPGSKITNDSLLRFWNAKNPLNLNIQYGKFERADSNEFAELIFQKPANKTAVKKLKSLGKIRNDEFVWVKINRFIPTMHKSLEEAKGPVINDLQIQIEKDWLVSLEKKYPVVMNTANYEAFKKKMLSL